MLPVTNKILPGRAKKSISLSKSKCGRKKRPNKDCEKDKGEKSLEVKKHWAVAVVQLVAWLLPTPEICGSKPYIGKIYLPIVHFNRKYENKQKEAENGAY